MWIGVGASFRFFFWHRLAFLPFAFSLCDSAFPCLILGIGLGLGRPSHSTRSLARTWSIHVLSGYTITLPPPLPPSRLNKKSTRPVATRPSSLRYADADHSRITHAIEDHDGLPHRQLYTSVFCTLPVRFLVLRPSFLLSPRGMSVEFVVCILPCGCAGGVYSAIVWCAGSGWECWWAGNYYVRPKRRRSCRASSSSSLYGQRHHHRLNIIYLHRRSFSFYILGWISHFAFRFCFDF